MQRLAEEDRWTVVVIGDQKTPSGWYSPNVHYISVEDQQALGYSVLKKMSYGSYARYVECSHVCVSQLIQLLKNLPNYSTFHDSLISYALLNIFLT